MDKAKAAVSDFMAKAGKHDTTVHEKVAPAVTHETINAVRHENVTTAVDKEVHQDHYHHSVQPVLDREVLPEQHSHQLGQVEHRKFDHGNHSDVKARLEQEAAQFHDKRVVGETRETQSVKPTIQGEHVHHHVHETIQPVVHKETIQPSVVHTTVPIHEVHHNAAQHHSTTALPAVSMADFKKQGGILGGREERYDGFEGEPRAIGGALGSHGHHEHGHHEHGHHEHGTTGGLTGGRTGDYTDDSSRTGGLTGSNQRTGGLNDGPHRSGLENKMDPRVDSDRDGRRGVETGSHSHGSQGYGDSTTGSTGKKPSLMDKLNPKVDANGDGKPGFMK